MQPRPPGRNKGLTLGPEGHSAWAPEPPCPVLTGGQASVSPAVVSSPGTGDKGSEPCVPTSNSPGSGFPSEAPWDEAAPLGAA